MEVLSLLNTSSEPVHAINPKKRRWLPQESQSSSPPSFPVASRAGRPRLSRGPSVHHPRFLLPAESTVPTSPVTTTTTINNYLFSPPPTSISQPLVARRLHLTPAPSTSTSISITLPTPPTPTILAHEASNIITVLTPRPQQAYPYHHVVGRLIPVYPTPNRPYHPPADGTPQARESGSENDADADDDGASTDNSVLSSPTAYSNSNMKYSYYNNNNNNSSGMAHQHMRNVPMQVQMKMSKTDFYVPARRLAQSRLVGQRHRTNEKIRTAQLESEVKALQEENDYLRQRVSQYMYTTTKCTNTNTNTNRNSNSNSNSSNLSVAQLPHTTVMLLLELISGRRNLTPLNSFCNITLECPPENYVTSTVQRYRQHIHAIDVYVHDRWSQFESDPAYIESITNSKYNNNNINNNNNKHKNKNQTNKYTPNHNSEDKRCTRCGKLRAGHPRSSCDDGFKVGSLLPYPSRTTGFS